VFAVFDRAGEAGRHGHPSANMFDQPELEQLLRTNLEDQTTVTLRGNVEVTDVAQDGLGRVRVDFTDRRTSEPGSVLATYVLGCDGANSVVRTAIGATMEDLDFEQRWLVIDVASMVELDQWEGVHQLCDPERAATYMRIGRPATAGSSASSRARPPPTSSPSKPSSPSSDPGSRHPVRAARAVRVAEYHFRAQLADRWRDRNVFLLGDAAHLTPPSSDKGSAPGPRRHEPQLEDRRRALRRPARVGARHLRGGAQAARPALIKLAKLVGVSMTQGGKAGDLLRKAIAPRLHWVPGLRDRLLDSETPPLRRSAWWKRRGPASRSTDGCARTRSSRTASGTTTSPAAGSCS
jgi:3-(3-hydroxy-phenyl)propionate hydroxylase